MKAMLEMVPLGWVVDAVLRGGVGVSFTFFFFFRNREERGECNCNTYIYLGPRWMPSAID